MSEQLRPRLLVSVRNGQDAEAALAGGADWIDLKEPSRGALGAVDAAVAREVVALVDGRVPVSAAAGELVEWPRASSRQLLDVEGLSLLKLGLAHCGEGVWQTAWTTAQHEIAAANKQLAAVIYADEVQAVSPSCAEVVDAACESPCQWLLLDTYDKRAGKLFDNYSLQRLVNFLSTARAHHRRIAVAGSLTRASIAALPLHLIDVVAVRGAACRGDRSSPVCAERVAELRALLAARSQAPIRAY